ncbi:MAG: hypothetical protein J4F37_08820, partial [Acidobacteria bacterium]|nr:hypothetical protein [Acidobacteriota bacterium]
MPMEEGRGPAAPHTRDPGAIPSEQEPRDVVIEQQDGEIGRLRDDLARHKSVHRENGRLQRRNHGLQRQIERLERE